MRLAMTVVSPEAGLHTDVLLDADPGTSVGVIARELAGLLQGPGLERTGMGRDGRLAPLPGPPASAGHTPPSGVHLKVPTGSRPGPGPAVYVDRRLVPPDCALAASLLRNGCVVSLGDPTGCLPPEPAGLVEIRVVGGPATGAVHRLAVGRSEVGTGPGAHIRLDPDPDVPALAVRVEVDPSGASHVSAHTGITAFLDREPLSGAALWKPWQQLSVGSTLLECVPYEPPDAALHPGQDGVSLDFNRPPRVLPPARTSRFALPAPPGRAERRPLPILMAVLPILLGVLLAVVMHAAYMLAMTALSPVMLAGNYLSDRRQGRRSHAQQVADYAAHTERVERDAREALAAERAQRRATCPDPAAVLTIASGPRRRLWERRRSDPDYLLLRVGTADLPSGVELEDPARDEHRRRITWTIPDAPVTVPLPERGVLGVAGPGDAPRSIARWLVTQIAVLHTPSDVRIYLLTDSGARQAWEWIRWLPHCQPAETRSAALIGNDAETVAARIAELLSVVNARGKELGESTGQSAHFREGDVVVIVDGSRRLRSMPGVIQILREGPRVGVYSICLDTDESLLPAEAHAVVAAGSGGLRVEQMSEVPIGQVRPDYVTPAWCARLARGLAPVRDTSDEQSSLGLPSSSRLLDVLGLEPPVPEAIISRWNSQGRTTVAVAGESYDGPFGIDIHQDGPHGLIAGTTGSGKSELLQTIVASLAAVNRPDAMTFVLVDYKGGSAFRECADLPHTVGMVTDLDPHLVERALASLSAELTRREHILAAAGARDIDDYTDLVESGVDVPPWRRPPSAGSPVLPCGPVSADGPVPPRWPVSAAGPCPRPLPRLLIVIDEFASMARDLPDFVTGLVNIAQRGRSLGIHLILATQRPSGVVSPEIRANTNLRIALRVTDPAESADVIDAADAAHISKSTPGRAYARLGHSSLVPFQTARVGGRRPGAAADPPPPWLARIAWAGLGRPAPHPPARQAAQPEEITDLKVLAEAITQASATLGVPPPHRPWLPALPGTLLLADLPGAKASGAHVPGPADGDGTLPVIPYGLDDLPAEQAQRTAVVDLASFGHMIAAGGPRSGRSQLLRTIAGSIAATQACDNVHLYGIDCGNGALLPLAALPHCGAVVTRTETERAARLITRLGQEADRRQALLAGGGFADIGEQRAGALREGGSGLTHVIVLLDRWEGFTSTLSETDNGRLTEVITRILGEGASIGMHLIITGDRSVLAGRISTLTDDKLAFKLPDRDDFTLAGLRPRDLPAELPPGRALRGGSGMETQVALLAPDASGPGQAAALTQLAAEATRRDAAVPRDRRPFRVDALPAHLTFADAWRLRDSETGSRPLWAMVGAGGDELAAQGADLGDGVPAFIVAGPPKSGRSTLLAVMARSLLQARVRLILVTPRPSPLRSLRSEPAVLAVFEDSGLAAQEFSAALADLSGPAVVVIDDAELIRDTDAAAELKQIIDYGGARQRALILGGNAEDICSGFTGWQVDAKRARRGCLLSPQQITDGDLIGVRLSRSQVGQPVRPGRALFNSGDGELSTVSVPLG